MISHHDQRVEYSFTCCQRIYSLPTERALSCCSEELSEWWVWGQSGAAKQSSRLSFMVGVFYASVASLISCELYRGADKSLARPGRKEANVSVRMV